MKKLRKFSLWLLVVAALVSIVSVSQGAVVITTTASVGPPPISPSYVGYTNQGLYALSTGADPFAYPVSAPWAYVSAPNPLHWGEVAVDNSGQSVWDGQVITDTSSPFYGEKGTAFYVTAVIAGDGVHKINVNDVSFNVTSTDPAHSLNGSGGFAGFTYGVDPIVGIVFGPDGKSFDGVYYNQWNPAPGTTKVDEILCLGPAVGFNATDVGLGYVEDYVNGVEPFDLTIAYTVNDGTGLYSSSQTRTVVPEPATISLLALGAITLIRRRRSR